MAVSITGPKTKRLAALAKPLSPEREPWYVTHPVPPALERTFPAAGWYWVPPEHAVAVFLGASFELATHNLHTLLDNAA